MHCLYLLVYNNRFFLLSSSNISKNKQLLYLLSRRYFYSSQVKQFRHSLCYLMKNLEVARTITVKNGGLEWFAYQLPHKV